ncbi:MAG: DUF3015 family protein [SAR324 cluster bacterium]|nr:DUF3015 family protein [SAR324 cluster bacterium]
MQQTHNKIRILLLFCSLLFLLTSAAGAYCNKKEYFGITSGSPAMSTVDVVFSPFYSITSTSGTSGCKNWDFAQYLEDEQKQFIVRSNRLLLEEVVQGNGIHIETLGQLMGCPASDYPVFATMLKQYYVLDAQPFKSTIHSENAAHFLKQLKQWISQDSQLQQTCHASG